MLMSAKRPLREEKGAGIGTKVLLDVLDCPICMEAMMPPTVILSCAQGHLFCNGCFAKLGSMPKCPECRMSIARPTRNRALELLALNMEFPCQHQGNGCAFKAMSTVLTEHGKKCKFRPQCCWFDEPNCDWQGPPSEAMAHYVRAHKLGELVPVQIAPYRGLQMNPNKVTFGVWQAIPVCNPQSHEIFFMSFRKRSDGYFASISPSLRGQQGCRACLEVKNSDRSYQFSIELQANSLGPEACSRNNDGLLIPGNMGLYLSDNSDKGDGELDQLKLGISVHFELRRK